MAGTTSRHGLSKTDSDAVKASLKKKQEKAKKLAEGRARYQAAQEKNPSKTVTAAQGQSPGGALGGHPGVAIWPEKDKPKTGANPTRAGRQAAAPAVTAAQAKEAARDPTSAGAKAVREKVLADMKAQQAAARDRLAFSLPLPSATTATTPLAQMSRNSTSWSMLEQGKDAAKKAKWPEKAIGKMTAKQDALHLANVGIAKPYDITFDAENGVWRGGESYGEWKGAQVYDAQKALPLPGKEASDMVAVARKVRETAAAYRPKLPTAAQAAENRAKSAQRAKDTLMWPVHQTMAAIGGVSGSFYDTANMALETTGIDKFLPDAVKNYMKNSANTGHEVQEQVRAVNYERGGKLGGAVGDLAQLGVEMLGQYALAAATGGASAGAQLGAKTGTVSKALETIAKSPNFWYSFVRTAGPEYQQAIANGASKPQAATAAILSALGQAGVEVGGGVETLAGKAAGGVKGAVKSMLEEGGEEVTQDLISGLAHKGVYDKGREWLGSGDSGAVVNPQRMAGEFAMGALGAGLPVGVNALAGRRRAAYSLPLPDVRDGASMAGQAKTAKGQTDGFSKEALQAALEGDPMESARIKTDFMLGSDSLNRYQDQVNRVFTGKMPRTERLELGETPELLIEYGAQQRPVTMTQDTAMKIAYPSGYLGIKHGHNLDIPALKRLPLQIANPEAILRSTSQPNSFVLLTKWVDSDGAPVIAAIHLDKQGRLSLENEVASAYGKRNFEPLLGKNNENVLWTKNNQDIKHLLDAGLQLPGASRDDILIDYSIAQTGAESKAQGQETPFYGLPLPASFPEQAKTQTVALPLPDVQDGGRALPQDIQHEIDNPESTEQMQEHTSDAEYRAQIDGAFDGSLPSGRKITLGETPEIIQQYGANAREMTMTQTVARKIAYLTGYLGLKHGHNLGMSVLKNLPQQLRDPVAILKNPQPNTSGADSVIILTEWNDKEGNPIVVPIQLDVTGALDIPENIIVSTFGAEYIDRILGENDGNVLYTKNSENIRQLLSNGRPMPEAMADDIFAKTSIPQNGQNGNTPNSMGFSFGELQDGTFGRDTVGAAQAGVKPGRKVSRVSSNTFTESRIFNEAEKRTLEIFDREGGALYDVVSEKTSLQNAKDRLETDYEGEVAELPEKPNFSGEDNDTAMGILSRKLEEARKSGDYTEVEKWAKLIKEKGTQGGQLIQSFAKYTRTPEGAVVQGQREVDAAVKLWENKNPKALPKLQKQGYLVWTKDDMKQVSGIMQQAQDAGLDSPQGRTFEAQAMAVIAKRLPVQNQNKVISLLMDNMLGNFRTLIARNAGGNLIFTAPEALRENLIAAPVDALTSLATKQRTTYFDPAGKSASWARGFAKGGMDMASDIKTGVHTARSGETASIQAQQKTFRDKGFGKVLNAYDAFVGTMLEAGDRPFYEGAYAAKMRDLEHARKQGKLTKDFAGKDFDAYAPLVARQAAMEAVFQNDGTVAKGMSKLAEAMKLISEGTTGAGFLNQAAMPFTRTPGNLAERAIEYSPIGAVKNALRTGSEIKRGTFNQQRFVNETSRNLIGSGLLVLAGKLVQNGVIQGSLSDDKDEREAQKNAGMQDYSVKIGDHYVSYAWIPVIGPALAGGADFYQTLNGSDLGALAAVGDAAAGYVQSAVFEQSALSGLSEMFSGDNAAKGVVDTLLSLPTQFVPSMMRQAAAAADPYERQTYVNGDQIQSQLGSLKSAIPGLRQTLPIKRDEQGEIKKASQGRSGVMRVLENMLLPAKITKDVSNDVRDELSRLKRETGETRQFQNKVTYAVERNGKKIPLTPAQSMDYQKDFGKASTAAIRKLMHSGAYAALSDEEKVDAISNINSYAKKLADAKYVSVKFENSEKRMKDAGISPGIWYGYSKMKSILKKEKDPEANWKVTEQILADEELSRAEKDAVLENLVIAGISEESAEKYAEEYRGVMKPETYIRLRSEYAKIKKQFEGEDNAAGKRQAAWISYLDRTGLPAEQRAKVEEDIKFWSMFPAKPESTSFDMLSRYGGKNEQANAAAMENAGLSIGQYYAAKEYKSGLKGDGQKERVLAWMREQGWTAAQIRAAGSALGYKMSSGKKGGSKKYPLALPTQAKLPSMKSLLPF